MRKKVRRKRKDVLNSFSFLIILFLSSSLWLVAKFFVFYFLS